MLIDLGLIGCFCPDGTNGTCCRLAFFEGLLFEIGGQTANFLVGQRSGFTLTSPNVVYLFR